VRSIPFQAPFDWEGLLAFLGRRQVPELESVSNGLYSRYVALGSVGGVIEVRPAPTRHALLVHFPEAFDSQADALLARVRHIFDMDAGPEAIRSVLGNDPFLDKILTKFPGLRVPGSWDPFELAVRAILGQQVSVAAATTIAGRLVRKFGRRITEAGGYIFPEPATLANAELESLGLVRSRAASIRALALAVIEGRLALDGGGPMEHSIEQLTAIPGVGPWTAHYIAMRALRFSDAFPAADLILRRSASATSTPISVRDLTVRAEAWRPWRAYGAIALWRGYQPAPVLPRERKHPSPRPRTR
jgi:AraC family transcriptional regulator of adaptative response / DNA-3-methyladenine glycosylase II